MQVIDVKTLLRYYIIFYKNAFLTLLIFLTFLIF